VKTDKVSSHKKEKVIPQAIAVATAVPTPNKKGTGRKGKISNFSTHPLINRQRGHKIAH
jgi:hypothetical protein